MIQEQIQIQLGCHKFKYVPTIEKSSGKLAPVAYLVNEKVEIMRVNGPTFVRSREPGTCPIFLDARRQELIAQYLIDVELVLTGTVRLKTRANGTIILGIFVPYNMELIEFLLSGKFR